MAEKKGYINCWHDPSILSNTIYTHGQEADSEEIVDTVFDLYSQGFNIMLLHTIRPDRKPQTTIMVDTRNFRQR